MTNWPPFGVYRLHLGWVHDIRQTGIQSTEDVRHLLNELRISQHVTGTHVVVVDASDQHQTFACLDAHVRVLSTRPQQHLKKTANEKQVNYIAQKETWIGRSGYGTRRYQAAKHWVVIVPKKPRLAIPTYSSGSADNALYKSTLCHNLHIYIDNDKVLISSLETN